jgi:aldose 1-epimerase
VVHLADAARGMQVSLAPSVGNLAYQFAVHGKNVLWFPFRGPDELKAAPALCGIPFLAPWANRLDGETYWVNGNEYALNPALGNLRRDGNQKPIHGLLLFSPAWELISVDADAESAYAASRLEFWKHPELMAQFPFAHEITMGYRLANGSLEVSLLLTNLCAEPMPVAIGYHPYFQLNDAPRDEWNVHIAARDHLSLDEFLIPTGDRRPVAFADPHPLRARPIDDVFTNLIRDADGAARFWVTGKQEKLTVTYGPGYQVAVIYAPPDRDFICFEPMAAITNAFNLARHGMYPELQNIAPGGQWRGSFWITPEGFTDTSR